MRSCLRLVFAGLLYGGLLRAQASDTLLRRGARVRLWSQMSGYAGQPGTFDARSADSLELQLQVSSIERVSGAVRVRLAVSQVDSLEVAVKTGMTAMRGAKIGIAIGGIVGIVAGGLYGLSLGGSLNESPGKLALLGAIVGGLLGEMAGGVVGLMVGAGATTRWVAVSLR
jgi:hypothetical protein